MSYVVRRRGRLALALLALPACRFGFDPPTPGLDASGVGVDGSAAADGSVDADGGLPLAPTVIYRSVGPASLEPLALGGRNALQVNASVATFAGDLPPNVGVGDALEYAGDGAGTRDVLAFVGERQSPRSYRLVRADGAPIAASVAATQNWAIFRAYTSLGAAAQGEPNASITLPFDGWSDGPDLVSRRQVWQIACYGDAPDQGPARFLGWRTTATYHLRIFTPVSGSEAGVSQRHGGVWEPSKYWIEGPSGGRVLEVVGASVRVDGLQISVTNNDRADALPYGINLRSVPTAGIARVSNTLVRGDNELSNGAIPRGIFVSESSGSVQIWNNVIYDIGGTSARPGYGINIKRPGLHAVLYNNTIVGAFNPVVVEESATAVLINNITMGGGTNIRLTQLVSGSNNLTQDQSAADLAIGSQLPSANVTDYFRGPSDLHIDPVAANASVLVDQGVDLSSDAVLPFGTDFDGTPRPAGSWDIGADELAP